MNQFQEKNSMSPSGNAIKGLKHVNIVRRSSTPIHYAKNIQKRYSSGTKLPREKVTYVLLGAQVIWNSKILLGRTLAQGGLQI